MQRALRTAAWWSLLATPLWCGCESSSGDASTGGAGGGGGGGGVQTSSSITSGSGGQGDGEGGAAACGGLGEACCAGQTCSEDETTCDAGSCTGCIRRLVGGPAAGGGCVETKSGKQRCWGRNHRGQVVCGGLPSYLPTELDHLGSSRVASVADHVCAITDDDKAYCWGHNEFGKAGLDPAQGSSLCPGTVVGLPGPVTRLSAGERTTLALQSDGTVYGWGSNGHGQLFIDSATDALPHPTPVRMDWAPPSSDVLALRLSSCVLTLDKKVVCVGTNLDGRLGTTDDVGQPARVEVAVDDVEDLVGDEGTVCTRNGSGEVWCWGNNSGDQIDWNRSTPLGVTRVVLPGLAKRLAMGGGTACAILADDTVYCWGSNYHYQLAACELGFYPGPRYIFHDEAKTEKLRAKSLSIGYGHVCSVDLNDQLWCWGANQFFNALGDSALNYVCTPTRATIPCD